MVYDEHLHNGARNSVAKLAALQGNNNVRRADKNLDWFYAASPRLSWNIPTLMCCTELVKFDRFIETSSN